MKFKMIFFFILVSPLLFAQNEWIRVNQLGYLPNSIKTAVFLSKGNAPVDEFEIWDADKNQKVREFTKVEDYGEFGNFRSSYRLDFSEFEREGKYYLKAGEVKSPSFEISHDVYDGTADVLLKYMRQQRCGYNPFLEDSCHTEDGFIVDHPTLDSIHIDVTGGWHDASDYLQYLPTSANAVHQMLFAYRQNPESFSDNFDAAGNRGANGIPDILDEAKWGLDWMVKMNPDSAMMFNQIADDRDHAGYRLPTKDSVDYGKGLERPVYFITGKKQGICEYKNRTQGVSSSAGKFASSFALGSQILKKYYPKFTDILKNKAEQAYGFANTNYGATQTASCVSPYFYEEDNYVDDLELAAIQLYNLTGEDKYLSDALKWGIIEPVTPWMGADTASHYQWYPFVNLGHYLIAESDVKDSQRFSEFMEKGLNEVYEEGKDNPFLIGIPFIWCSNNLVAGLLTQAHLYEKLTGDDQYAQMEAALRDWLFGANPWGTSMIVALPENGDYPDDPHSAFSSLYGYRLDGGLVDGPVYSTIFNKLRGITVYGGDEYENVQPGMAVYHDDHGDYSTNEPTMDGTASLSYYLSAMEKEGELKKKVNFEFDRGGIIRFDKNQKNIYLVFTGGDFADGGDSILNTLDNNKIRASFFFTGDFYRTFPSLVAKIKEAGHYLGAHSDKHLLYADWTNRDSLLVSEKEFKTDLMNNYSEMKKFGIEKVEAQFYLPPYEWYNDSISVWTNELGLTLMNFSPGTYSNADYTTPEMGERYLSSEEIYNRILSLEEKDPNGLNGFILLLHIGTDPKRTDKFYFKLDDLIKELQAKGYYFISLNQK